MTTDVIRTEQSAWEDYFRNFQGVQLLTNPEFQAPELDDQIQGKADAFGSSVLGNGIISKTGVWIHDQFKYDSNDRPDPNFNPLQTVEKNEFFKDVFDRAAQSEDRYDRQFVTSVLNAKNQTQFDTAYRRYMRDKEAVEAMDEHPWAAAFGMVTGFIPDIAASIVVPSLIGRWAPTAATGVASVLTGAPLAARSAMAARAVATARVGVTGAAEGFLDAATQDLLRTTFEDDYYWNTLMGAGLGSLLGFAMPRVVGGVSFDSEAARAGKHSIQRMEDVVQSARKDSEFAGSPQDAGAAITPKAQKAINDIDLEIESSPFLATRAVNQGLGRTIGTGRLLMSPKTLIAQYFELARKYAGTPTGQAMGTVANITGRIFSPNVVYKHNVLGGGHVRTMTDVVNEMDAKMQSRRMSMDKHTALMNDLIREHYGVVSLDKARQKSDVVDRLSLKAGADVEHMPDTNDLWNLADKIAHMRRINEKRAAADLKEGEEPPAMITEDQVWNAVPNFKSVPEEFREDIMKIAKTISDEDDAFFKEFEDRLVASGFLDEGDMINHYRSQLWNADRVSANPYRFRKMLYRILEKEPAQEWVNDNFIREALTDDAPPAGKFWEDGETWSQVYARNPEAAREVLEEWGFAVRKAKYMDLKNKENGMKAVLEDLQVKDAAQLEERWGKMITATEKRIGKAEAKLAALEKQHAAGQAGLDEEMSKLERVIAKNYMNLMQQESNVKLLSEVLGDMDEMRRLQGRFKTTNRTKSKTALGKLRKAEKKSAAVAASKTIDEVIREMQEGIGAGTNARMSDLPMDRMRQGNTRMLRRVLDLQDEEFGEDARFFLNSNPAQRQMQYVHTLGRRLAFKEVMEPYVQKMRPGSKLDGTEADIATIRGIVQEEFAKARDATTDKKLLKMLHKEQRKAIEFLDNQFELWNNLGRKDPRDAGWMEVILSGTAAHALGSVLITQLTDLPTAMLAMPGNVKAGAFMNSLFNPIKRGDIKEILAEVEKSDKYLYSILRGINAYETTRWEKMVDVRSVGDQLADVHDATNSGVIGMARAMAREGGKLQAYASGAPYWNSWVQNSFGHVFMDAMNEGIMDFKNLRKIDKEHYARLGIGELQADMMRKLLDDPKMTKTLGPGLKLPLKDKWPDDIYGLYTNALRRAQSESLIAPEIGDMPFWVNKHPLARLMYQFSSFAFAWSGQVLRKVIQRAGAHPSELRVYAPLVMGIAMGAMVMMIKNVLVYGKSVEETLDKPMPDLVWDTLSRSPLITGMGNSLLEGFFQFGGHAVNEMAGTQLLPQEANYFKRSQGPIGALGPAFGLMHGTYYKGFQQMAEGDFEKGLGRIGTQLPIANTFGIKALVNILGED